MKEAIVDKDTNVVIRDTPAPTPGPGQLLIKVVVFGTNPKDWKLPNWYKRAHNSGDDVAGYVAAVGSGVDHFVKGMRVAGMHDWSRTAPGTVPGGAFAEYALVEAHTTFVLPRNITFEEGATVPLAALTSALALFHDLGLPPPYAKTVDRAPSTPIVIYGLSTAIGAYALKLAVAADIHPIIAIGSSTSEFLRDYIDPSRGDAMIDYRQFKNPSDLTEIINDALDEAGCGPARHGFDAVTRPGTYFPVMSDVLKRGARPVNGNHSAGPGEKDDRPRLVVAMPGIDTSAIPKSIKVSWVGTSKVHTGDAADRQFGTVWTRLLADGLRDGWLTPHPHEVIEGGLAGLEDGLKRLRNDRVKGKKLVGRIADTPGPERFAECGKEKTEERGVGIM